jgi:uncharacterized protein DUF1835
VSTLHITNGDSAGDKLRRIVKGAVTITADPLHEGPAPPVDGDAWYDVRARFLASDGDTAREEVKQQLAAWDRAIADGHRAGDIVLWFEHDLFDQLALIRTLDLLVRLNADTTYDAVSRVSLICIDSFPGVERFVGLGQLTPGQLAELIGTERPVTLEQYALASRAWKAFRSPDPAELLAITVKPQTSRALPFLPEALLRFFAEFPSAANGLSRTEELALGALCDGRLEGGALFAATQTRELRPFLGDTIFFGIVRRLATARVPLVSISEGLEKHDLRSHVIAITDAGREVLAGRSDHIALNGLDLWRGGVHLAGRDASPWRWNARSETLVS